VTDPTIIQAAETIFAPWFRDRATWCAWFTFLRALFGIPLVDNGELALFRECTGRAAAPLLPINEAWLICGRRAGKSMILALIAVFLATCREWRPHLSPGERGTILILAADRRQARTIFRYCRALLLEVPELAGLVERETADAIDLSNGVTIEVLAANFRGVRGYSIVAALCDETAFWRNEESANPDTEILAALRPAMATIPGAMLLCASSPYARRGALWEAYRRHYGRDDAPALIWRAPTRVMNPTVPEAVIAEAYERDPASAAAEYGAEFRSDVETFLSREVIDAAVVPDRHELPPVAGVRYIGFTDPSGGSADSFTIAVAHREDDGRIVVDAIRERIPPFSPEAIVVEFADLLKTYNLREVTGDRYGGEWPRERFREHGIEYRPAERAKSDLYGEMLPLMNAARVELPDQPRLLSQLAGLERRTARGGRDSIDHGPGAHDDLANVVAGAVVVAAGADGPVMNRGLWGFIRGQAAEIAAEEKASAEERRPKPEAARGSLEWAEHLAEQRPKADPEAMLGGSPEDMETIAMP